jgi:hypothetical protein
VIRQSIKALNRRGVKDLQLLKRRNRFNASTL